MSAISAMPTEIAEWLGEQEELSEYSFITEYPPTKKAIPLRNPVIAVGIDGIEIEDSFNEEDGVLVENEYCRLATIKIRLSIHVPFSHGGAACYDAFTSIIDCLSFASDLNIIVSGCDDITADRDTDAFVLKGRIELTADFCPAISSDISFNSFLNKDLLCGTHISNSAIHVTQTDKDRWNAPFVTGTYFGTGTSSRSISLGFAPRIVIAFANTLPPQLSNFTAQTQSCFFGIASSSGDSQGIELTGNGFRLLNGTSQTVAGCTPLLNQGGSSYVYIAFK